MRTAVEFAVEKLEKFIPSGNQLAVEVILEQALEMEKEQREKDFINGYKKRAELSGLIFDEASELSAKQLFKQQEQ
jgi:hypothetical protein